MPIFTEPQVIGLSPDHRTNRWRVTCPACGSTFEPQTTMSRYQHMSCPRAKCGCEMQADYNAEPPVVKIIPVATKQAGGANQGAEGEKA